MVGPCGLDGAEGLDALRTKTGWRWGLYGRGDVNSGPPPCGIAALGAVAGFGGAAGAGVGAKAGCGGVTAGLAAGCGGMTRDGWAAGGIVAAPWSSICTGNDNSSGTT